jgi:hypothetical protein
MRCEIHSVLDVQDWQRRTNDALSADQQNLIDRYNALEANLHDLMKAFGISFLLRHCADRSLSLDRCGTAQHDGSAGYNPKMS